MRRISPATVTVGVVAILLGLVAANVARHYLKVEAPKPVAQPAPAPKVPMATYVVSRINLPTYARVHEQDLRIVECPAEQLPAGAVPPNQALGRLVKATIMASQPILNESLYPVGEVPLLAEKLPLGKRAVTITVDANNAINGMLQPDSRVDIALTVDDKHPELQGLATLTLARNMQVLATNVTRFPGTEDRATNVRNVTVAATPEEANRLILAQRYGSLSLTLRGGEDALAEAAGTPAAEAEGNDLVNTMDLLGLQPPAPPEMPAPPEPEPIPVQKKVEVWRGESRQELTFTIAHLQEAEDATAAAEGRPAEQLSPFEPADVTAKKKECKDCKKKNAPQPPAPQPTMAPAPAGDRVSALSRPLGNGRQMIEVRVEADSAGVLQ